MISNHLSSLSKSIEKFMSHYDNIIILGDFNSEMSEDKMREFCEFYNLKNLVKEPTCYKNPLNPSCIDLIITNQPKSFQNTKVIETGLSDFHKLSVSVLKTFFKKQLPNIISYRDYRNYYPTRFRSELFNLLDMYDISNISNDDFVNIFMFLLNIHAPIKHKYVRANDNPFVTKEMRKAIMLRSKLRNRYNKLKTMEANLAYKRQRNICTSLLKKTKRKYYESLNPSAVIDNKNFWKVIKPYFSGKVTTKDKIALIEDNEICDKDEKVAKIFNTFFSNAVSNLEIQYVDKFNHPSDEPDPIVNAIIRYKDHPSIKKINDRMKSENSFSFLHVTLMDIIKEISDLDVKKASPNNSIPPKLIKENQDIFAYKLFIDFNASIYYGLFPNNCKYADISPAFKKGDRLDRSNYRPVSILPSISKIFERLMYSQIDNYMEPKLSIYQCGFRKNLSSQNCLLFMVEKLRQCLDNKGFTGILLTDLSKAFDCLVHDLLIAKLHAYGFEYNAIKLIYSYFNGRYQRVRINSTYSSWSEIIFGVPQGSILGPLFFNIYLMDLFIFCENSDISNYADDNSPFSCNSSTESVILQLVNDSKLLCEWFANNGFKANPDKFHLILNENRNDIFIEIQQFKIFNSNSQKLLGIKVDNKLSFDDHVRDLCNKASQKLHALARIAHYMQPLQKRIIMKAFINSQFGYCPLVWMFHSRTLNNRINKIHERALRMVYNDNISTFDELLSRDKSVSIHIRNIQTLAIELYKVVNSLSPAIMTHIFPLKETLLYSSKSIFKTSNVRTTSFGLESLRYLGPKIWDIIPTELKSVTSLNIFKAKIKLWNPQNCPCKLCKVYICGVGYMN